MPATRSGFTMVLSHVVLLSILLFGCSPGPLAVPPTLHFPPAWTPTSLTSAAQEAAPLPTHTPLPSPTESPVAVTAVLPTPIPTSTKRDSAGVIAACASVLVGTELEDDLYLVDASGGPPINLTAPYAWEPWCYAAPEWSPDGSRIAFQSRPAEPQASADTLWTINIDGTGLTDLSSTIHLSPGVVLEDPVWSPDGSNLAFIADENWMSGRRFLFVSPADGTRVRQLTSDSIRGRPVWSADGQSIYYVVGINETYALHSVSLEDGASARVMELMSEGLTWSPDRTRIAQDVASGIYFTNLGTQDTRRIEYPAPEPEAMGAEPLFRLDSWSPTGDQLDLIALYPPNWVYLYAIEADAGRTRLVVRLDFIDGLTLYSWSPSGRDIAFVDLHDCDASSCKWDVYRVQVDGGSPQRLTNDGHASPPSWSPDGRQLAFVSSSQEQGQDTLFVVDSAGSKSVEVLRAFAIPHNALAWSPLK